MMGRERGVGRGLWWRWRYERHGVFSPQRHRGTKFFCHQGTKKHKRAVYQQLTPLCVFVSPGLRGINLSKTSANLPDLSEPQRNLPALHPPQELHNVAIARRSACPAYSGIFEGWVEGA